MKTQRIALLVVATSLLGGVMLRGAETENTFLPVTPAPERVIIDGSLAEWDPAGAIFICPELKRNAQGTRLWLPEAGLEAHDKAAAVSAMYDRDFLYLGVHVKDASPLQNSVNPEEHPGDGWKGDCLQFRFRVPTNGGDQVFWLESWFYQRNEKSALILTDRSTGGRQDLRQSGGDVSFRASSGESYIQEIRIPWTSLGVSNAPSPGFQIGAGVEIVGGPDSSGKGGFHFADVIKEPGVERSRFFAFPERWGIMKLMDKGETVKTAYTIGGREVWCVSVNPRETVVEFFRNAALGWEKSWTVGSASDMSRARMRRDWNAAYPVFQAASAGDYIRIQREYDLDVTGFDELVVRVRSGESVRTSMSAVVDGEEQVVFKDLKCGLGFSELAGPIRGQKLTGVTLTFTATAPGKYEPTLHWIVVRRPGIRWTPPEKPFDGMIVEDAVSDFSPGLGLVMNKNALEKLRTLYGSDAFAEIRKEETELARAQYAIDPASMIRPYSLYSAATSGRPFEESIDTGCDGLLLALMGLITRNEDYLRQAARHAVALARMDAWAEGFVDSTPALHWDHASFAANVATIKSSLLLDMTWNWLTPEGRDLVREAIRQKGLPRIERHKRAMANQGVRFNKGRILGHMAITDDWADPEFQKTINESLKIINDLMDKAVRPDGTFSEEANYGKGTTVATFLSYVAAARALATTVPEIVTPRLVPAMKYLHDAEGYLYPVFAAFMSGPMAMPEFSGQCLPTHLISHFMERSYGGTAGNASELTTYGLANVWAPKLNNAPAAAKQKPFVVYPDGGWIFMGSAEPAQPRVTFESGLWDGAGHAWLHKNAVTVKAWGQDLLLPRFHVAYVDSRSVYTMRTAANNTFSPGGRDQDASGTAGMGATLLAAEDLGPVVVVASDGATAWKKGVTKSLRRMVFVRPNILVIEDIAEFEEEEEGVQSWNSLGAWEPVDERTYRTNVGAGTAELTCLLPATVVCTSGEDSVHRDPTTSAISPVFRAAFTSPAAQTHHVVTLIRIGTIEDPEFGMTAEVLEGDPVTIKVSRGDNVILVSLDGRKAGTLLPGVTTDGTLTVLSMDQGRPLVAAAFDASRVVVDGKAAEGKGLVVCRP